MQGEQGDAGEAGEVGQEVFGQGAFGVGDEAGAAGPGQADAEAFRRCLVRGDAGVWQRRGNVVQGGAEEAGEAEEWGDGVERGEEAAGGDDRVDAGGAAEEADQCGLDGQDDAVGQGGDEGGVADELDCVAEALFGVEEDGSGWHAGVPAAGLREGSDAIEGEAAFVEAPCLGGELAVGEQGGGEVVAGEGAGGRQFQGGSCGGYGLVHAVEAFERDRAVCPEHGGAAVAGECRVGDGEGFVLLAEVEQDAAEGCGVVWRGVGVPGGSGVGQCGLGVAVGEEGVGEFAGEGWVVGGPGLGHEEGADGGAALAAAEEGTGEGAQEGWVLVAAGGEEGGGVVWPVRGEEGCGEAGDGGRVVGAGGEAAFPDVQGLLRHWRAPFDAGLDANGER